MRNISIGIYSRQHCDKDEGISFCMMLITKYVYYLKDINHTSIYSEIRQPV